MTLFDKGKAVYTSPLLGGGGTGHFAAVISDQPFDSALLWDPLTGLVIDNIYFGPPIPAPGALMLLGAAFAMLPRRRRASS
jgi:uncharacterized protein (TIGR03382 family)